MKIDELVNLSLIYDIYGKLLSLKQREIMKLYLFKNLQINEIAQLKQVSRQAVFNVIDSCTNKLKEFEQQLGLCKKLERIKNVSKNLILIKQELSENLSESNNFHIAQIKLEEMEKFLVLLQEEL